MSAKEVSQVGDQLPRGIGLVCGASVEEIRRTGCWGRRVWGGACIRGAASAATWISDWSPLRNCVVPLSLRLPAYGKPRRERDSIAQGAAKRSPGLRSINLRAAPTGRDSDWAECRRAHEESRPVGP